MMTDYAQSREMNMPFDCAKIALLVADRVIVIRRDDRRDIRWPGHWDLPGGGREGSESPLACVLRETAEELNLAVGLGTLFWVRGYGKGAARRWFFAARFDADRLRGLRFGDEGTAWRLMPVAVFLQHRRAVPHLQMRLRTCLRRRTVEMKNPPLSSGGR